MDKTVSTPKQQNEEGIETHYGLSDIEFEQQFSTGVIDPRVFSHEAHLRLARIHVLKYGVDTAIKNMTSQIRAFAEANGDSEKYNHTVTIAAVRVIDHFITKSRAHSFIDFVSEFPVLKNGFRQLIEKHYSIDIFKSDEAKRNYLAPDLLPFGDSVRR